MYAKHLRALLFISFTCVLSFSSVSAGVTRQQGEIATLNYSSSGVVSCDPISKPLDYTVPSVTPNSSWSQPITAQGSGEQPFSVTCRDSANNPVTAQDTLTVTAANGPTVTLNEFNPSTITVGQSSTISFTSTNATSCTGSGVWNGNLGGTSATNASTGAMNTAGTYTQSVTCTGPNGSATSATRTLTVNPAGAGPACGTTHYQCTSGTASAGQTQVVGSGYRYNWTCEQGIQSVSCSETIGGPACYTNKQVTWGPACNGEINIAATPYNTGQTVTIDNRNQPSYVGTGTFRCNEDDTWTYVSGTCTPPPPAGYCAPGLVEWEQTSENKTGTEKCSGYVPNSQQENILTYQTVTDSILPTTGTAQFTCWYNGYSRSWMIGNGYSCKHASSSPDAPRPDLTITSIDPSEAELGNEVTFSAIIANVGSSTASNFPNYMYFHYINPAEDWAQYTYKPTQYISTLAPGQSRTITESFTFPWISPSWYATAMANFTSMYTNEYDPSKSVKEHPGASNTLATPVWVWERTPGTNLAVNPVKKSGNGALKVAPNGTLSVEATVRNRGNTATAMNNFWTFYSNGYPEAGYEQGGFDTTFQLLYWEVVYDEWGGQNQQFTHNVGTFPRKTPLGGGEGFDASATFTMPAWATAGRDVRIRACADSTPTTSYGGIVGETNETDNCSTPMPITISNDPYGTISASPNPCTINSGASSCNSTVTWTSNNISSPKVWNGQTEWGTGASGSKVATLNPTSNLVLTFKDSSGAVIQPTGTVTLSAVCASGTEWIGGACIVPPPPQVAVQSFTSAPRSVDKGGVVTMNWSIENPNNQCRILATVQKPTTCDATCQSERNAAQTLLNSSLSTGTTSPSDPNGAGRPMTTALRTAASGTPTIAKGRKSVSLDFSTTFTLSCGTSTPPVRAINLVVKKNEG